MIQSKEYCCNASLHLAGRFVQCWPGGVPTVAAGAAQGDRKCQGRDEGPKDKDDSSGSREIMNRTFEIVGNHCMAYLPQRNSCIHISPL